MPIMEFVTFPIRIGGDGWLGRAEDRSAGLMRVLGVIAGTSQAGWPGSERFGAREILLELQRRGDVRLIAVRQINQALEDLGIDWVSVSDIEREPSGESNVFRYLLTLSYPGQGEDVQRLELSSGG
ncbi:MAG TPA: hypothetical protein VJ302_16210 [Blastocatellia bacterium]|nr:hypothetical protein [Blastocatellia bacterium]